MNIWMAASLAVLVAGLVWVDLRTRRIPNGVTLPLLAVLVWLHWPGAPQTWLGCALLLLGWQSGWLGGGDAKLWMVLLWAVPPAWAERALLVMALSFLLTALAQLAWRRYRAQPVTGARAPAAWRALPYVAWLLTLR